MYTTDCIGDHRKRRNLGCQMIVDSSIFCRQRKEEFFSVFCSPLCFLVREKQRKNVRRIIFKNKRRILHLKCKQTTKEKVLKVLENGLFSMGDWRQKSPLLLLSLLLLCCQNLIDFQSHHSSKHRTKFPQIWMWNAGGQNAIVFLCFLFSLSLSLFHEGRNNSGTWGGLFSRIRGVSCT